MVETKTIYQTGVAAAGATVGYLYGEWSVMLEVLTGLAVADYATGWLASGVEGKLSSKVGTAGILKKLMMFLLVAACHLADRMIGQGSTVMTMSIFFYGANEFLSITENAGRAGLPVPGVVKQAIEVLKKKSGGDDANG